MNARFPVCVLALLASTVAFAQGNDDFATFPGSQAPPQKPEPQTSPAPADGFTPTPFPSAPAPLPPRTPAVSPPAAVPPPALAPAPVPNRPTPRETPREEEGKISREEKFLPGSAPHSPGTWGNRWDDPTNLRQTTGAFGGLGLLHIPSADLGTKGLLRFTAEGEYFTTHDFPVVGALEVRTAGNFAVSFVPLENLEAYLSYAASANTNTTSSPHLIEASGDVTLGAKVSKKWIEGLYAGADLRLQSFTGVGSQDLGGYAFAFYPTLMGLYDFRERWPKIPLRALATLGFSLDGTGNLIKTNRSTLTAAEQYAYNINSFNRFNAGIGLEATLPVVAPFLEYSLGVPLGVPNNRLIDPAGNSFPASRDRPQKVSIGFKVTAIRDVTVMAAVDLGLSRTVGLGVPAVPPFNFLFAASFAVDPFQRSQTKVVETIRERKPNADTGKIAGVVLDAQTKKPIAGVILAMAGAGVPPVASDADTGKFLTYELPVGRMKLAAQKEGYRDGSAEVVLEAGKTTTIEVSLEALEKKSSLMLTVTARKKPVAAAVSIKGAKDQLVQTTEADPGASKVEVDPGPFAISVNAPGFLAQTREVQISEGAQMAVAFDLTPDPKRRLVIVKDNRIDLAQQVHFATGRATILADSFNLLDQVVDAIVKKEVKRVRIEGHTDNRGSPAKNLKLSEDRAKAVADYLVKSGIDASRIESGGFGETRPVAPNLTARGRELNRRVEFIILDH